MGNAEKRNLIITSTNLIIGRGQNYNKKILTNKLKLKKPQNSTFTKILYSFSIKTKTDAVLPKMFKCL